ncbi:MAG: response regulator [Anaerolineae bacterium]|nr:response regulator [Anaerolineae bacterium]
MTGQRQRILIVDDEPRNIRLVENILYAEPYDLITARSGPEALEAVAKAAPDIVLLDIMMRSMSGFEVCRQIKSSPQHRMIPVVMVTALSDVNDRVEAMEAGADDFLSKPIDAAELIVRVRSLLRIRQLNQEVAWATTQRLRYMAGIAHDIRSPLNALELSMELLAARLPKDERLTALWSNITSCVDQIRMLSNDVMKYYQMEAGQFQLTYSRSRMADIVEAATSVALPLANEKGIVFLSGPIPDMVVEVDRGTIIQVLLNLLTNAIKYTDSGGQVELNLYDLSQSSYALPAQHYPPMLTLPNSGLIAEIVDTGRGIAAEDFHRIFTEFDRITTSDEDMDGVGLGLAVSQRLVRLHGGEIWFTSLLGQGSTFAFYLPRDQKRSSGGA